LIVGTPIHLMALKEPLSEQAGQVTDFALIGGSVGILVGLVRAFPMTAEWSIIA
jgi:hypothetical protein